MCIRDRIDIMRTHPMIIIGGVLQQNPFFVPPEEFLSDCLLYTSLLWAIVAARKRKD